jgi:hypothetical protein
LPISISIAKRLPRWRSARGAAGAAIARDIKAGMAALLAVAQFADDETTDEPISDGQEE